MRTILSMFVVIVLLFACSKEKQAATAELPENKTATYHIFASRDYNGTTVENTSAELRLQLRIINFRTGDQQLVWDSILPMRRLVDFPLYNQKLQVTKTYPVLNSHQKLNASYSVFYREGQIVSQTGKSDEAVPGVNAILLEANL